MYEVLFLEPKFVCPIHSEAKETETSELGEERSLLQGQARKMGGSCSKGEVFKGKMFLKATFGVRAAGHMTFF